MPRWFSIVSENVLKAPRKGLAAALRPGQQEEAVTCGRGFWREGGGRPGGREGTAPGM